MPALGQNGPRLRRRRTLWISWEHLLPGTKNAKSMASRRPVIVISSAEMVPRGGIELSV
jgi:hypothetical protein